MSRRALSAAGIALTVALGGCSAGVTDAALTEVAALSAPQVTAPPQWQRDDGTRRAAQARRDALLSEPLSADSAVALAMLGNRGLQADLAELGIAGADLAAASRPPNPGFSFARLTRGSELEIERSVSASVLGLLAWPATRAIERRRLEQATYAAASRVLGTAADARKAWFRAVAARQAGQFVRQIQDAAETQAELARRMYGVGNFSLLDYGREQLFYAEITVLTSQRELLARREHSRLLRVLGLEPGTQLRLPDRLPDLPDAPAGPGALEAQAMAERLDLRAGRAAVEGLAASWGLTRATRFVNVAEASYLRTRETGEPRQTGYEISLEVPLFDFGNDRVARAEAVYLQAVDRLAAQALDARLDVQEAWLACRTAWDVAVHYRESVMPLRQRLSEELAWRYNGMRVSVFDLLRDAGERMNASIAAIEAQRDFFIAETDLAFAARIGTVPSAPAPTARPPAAGGGH